MTTANITEEDLNDTLNHMHDLRVEIMRLNAALGRMFEKGLITDDMIAEALNDKIKPEDKESLSVIFCSWSGDKTLREKATEQFKLILQTINSYK
jgi:hypothetical protein